MSDVQLYGRDAGVDAVVYVDGEKYLLLDNGERREAYHSRGDFFESEEEYPEYVINTDD